MPNAAPDSLLDAFILLHEADPPHCLAACAARFAEEGIQAVVLDMRTRETPLPPSLLSSLAGAGARVVRAESLLSAHDAAKAPGDAATGYAACLNAVIGREGTPGSAGFFLARADTVPENACLALLRAAFALSPQQGGYGALGCRIVSPTGRILSEGRSFINGRGFNEPGLNRNFSLAEPAQAPQSVPHAAAATAVDGIALDLALIRRADFAAVGGFDARFFTPRLFLDDFCSRLQVRGVGVAVVAQAQAVSYVPHNFPGMYPAHPEHVKLLQQIKAETDAQLQAEAPLWAARWGWHPLYPDMGECRRRFGGTLLCRNVGDVLKNPAAVPGHRADEQVKSGTAAPASADFGSIEPCPIDLCMVTWNSMAVIDRCLDSLAATDYPPDLLTLFIVDNGSTDGTAGHIEGRAATLPFAVHLTRLPSNTGAVAAMNMAMLHGTAPVFAKLDDDIHVPPDWLRGLLRCFSEFPFAAVVGPKVLDDSPAGHIQCGPILQPPLFIEAEGQPDCGQFDYVCRVLHVRGCCCLYRRDAFERVGLLDIRFSPTQFDDLDHHIRFVEAGYDVVYDGRTAIRHKLTSGAYMTISSLGNVQGHVKKLQYKWGTDTIGNMEIALSLSADGRIAGKMCHEAPETSYKASREASHDGQGEKTPDARTLAAIWAGHNNSLTRMRAAADIYPGLVREQLADGHLKNALKAADTGLGLNPAHPELLALYADAADAMGHTALGARSRERARVLGWQGEKQTPPAPCGTAVHYGSTSGGPLQGRRVLLATLPGMGLEADVSPLLSNYAELAARQGADVTVWSGSMRELSDNAPFDIAHIFGLYASPHMCLDILKGVRAKRRILSPLLRDEGRARWAGDVLPRFFFEHINQPDLEPMLDTLASGRPLYNQLPDMPQPEAWSGFFRLCGAALRAADSITCCGPAEQALLCALARRAGLGSDALSGQLPMLYAVPKLFSAAGLSSRRAGGALGPAGISTAAGDGPAALAGVSSGTSLTVSGGVPASGGGYLLTVGPQSPADGLPVLLLAARLASMPVIAVGARSNRQYAGLCEAVAPEGSRFIEQATAKELREYMAGAVVYARTSLVQDFPDYGPVAAALGVPVLTSPGRQSAELLGPSAMELAPLDAKAIARALLACKAQAAQPQARDAAARALRNAARSAGSAGVSAQLVALYL